VKPSRLRSGEALAAAAAVALAVLLAFDWFFLSTPDARIGAHESGIRSLGWFAELWVLLAILSALALAFFTLANRAPGVPVMVAVLTTFLGVFATIAVAVRLIAQPGLGVEAGNADVEIELPAYLGLLAAMAITFGGWRTMADERTDTRESLEQTEDVLRVRGGPLPPPPRTIDPA
jgi:drug/metabolite transporter (DMT)-like permease